jgi:hypothetical protein
MMILVVLRAPVFLGSLTRKTGRCFFFTIDIMRENKSQFGKNPPKCYSFSWFNNATAGGTVKSKCFLS